MLFVKLSEKLLNDAVKYLDQIIDPVEKAKIICNLLPHVEKFEKNKTSTILDSIEPTKLEEIPVSMPKQKEDTNFVPEEEKTEVQKAPEPVTVSIEEEPVIEEANKEEDVVIPENGTEEEIIKALVKKYGTLTLEEASKNEEAAMFKKYFGIINQLCKTILTHYNGKKTPAEVKTMVMDYLGECTNVKSDNVLKEMSVQEFFKFYSYAKFLNDIYNYDEATLAKALKELRIDLKMVKINQHNCIALHAILVSLANKAA